MTNKKKNKDSLVKAGERLVRSDGRYRNTVTRSAEDVGKGIKEMSESTGDLLGDIFGRKKKNKKS